MLLIDQAENHCYNYLVFRKYMRCCMFKRSKDSLEPIIKTLKNVVQEKITSLLFHGIAIPEHCLVPVVRSRPIEDKNSTFTSSTSYDSRHIFSQAMLDTQMIEHAYSITAPAEQPNINKSALTRSFQQKLLSRNIIHHKTTYEILATEENTGSLQGSIFLDYENHIITVAFAGTRLDSTSSNMLIDIWDNLRLACGFITIKTEAIMRLNNYIITEFQPEIKDGWSLHYTGHSSGAHSADFAANHMCGLEDYITAQNFQDPTQNRSVIPKTKISVTSFESVGGITPLKNASAICGYKITDEKDQRLFEGSYYVFNSRTNFFNSLDKQSNALIFIIEHEEQGLNKWWQFWKTQTEHRSENFVKAFEGKGCIVGPDGKTITYSHNTISLPYMDSIETKIAKHSSLTTTEEAHHEFTITHFDRTTHTIKRIECNEIILAKILFEALHTNMALYQYILQTIRESAPDLIDKITCIVEGIGYDLDNSRDPDCDSAYGADTPRTEEESGECVVVGSM